jgi:polysaccharide export outer membrane protein
MKTKFKTGLILLLLALSLALPAIEITTQDMIPVSVSVTGDVLNPGIYTLSNLNRVTEALTLANMVLTPGAAYKQTQPLTVTGLTIPKPNVKALSDTTEIKIFGQRNVILKRNGQKQTLDLLKFFRLGEISQNPFLNDGDVIVVTPVHAVISIEGAVSKPGDYELKEGDTVKDILDLAFGITEDADLKHVMLYRYKTDYTEFDKTELDLSGYPEISNNSLMQTLQSGDRILVPANSEYRKAYKVQVLGKVRMPGIYYVNDKTSLYELLQMCGGPTKEADLNSSYAYNKLVSESYDPDFERLSNYSMLQMTWLEYSYLRTKTRQLKGRYSIDIMKCWNSQGKDANFMLKDGDEVIIPEQINGIWVAGQVKHPGLITWQENMTWKEYLQAAGGYANNRKVQGIRIIRYGSGNWVKATNKIKLNPGDAIFVPDKEEHYLWDDIKDAILITSQLLTILIALRTF